MSRPRKNTVLAAKAKEADRNAASQNRLKVHILNHMHDASLDFDRHKMNSQSIQMRHRVESLALQQRHRLETAVLTQQHKIERGVADAKMKRSSEIHKSKMNRMKKALMQLQRKESRL